MSARLKIGIISFTILILEMALIRFIPSEIKAISYFTNIIIFASFFGMGLGCILHEKPSKNWMLAASLFALCGFVYFSRGLVIYESNDSVHFWLQAGETNRYRPFANIPLFASAVIVFLLVSLPFLTLGQMLARQMSHHQTLHAYAWDVAGSLIGTLAFTATGYLSMPPWIWLMIVPLIVAWLEGERLEFKLPYVMASLSFLCFALTTYETRWSPYYLINYFKESNYLTVYVNASFHQQAINFASEDPVLKASIDRIRERFSTPYQIYREHHHGVAPRKVLILGAGTGNDAYIAAANGAEDITAVEIDPVILKLGREVNDLRPYENPKVRVVNDDARHFLWNTAESYDLIVFGTLDSQTLLSGYSNLRLENYVYTSESFADARRALADGGMMATYYSVFKPWFYGRIYATINKVFPDSIRLISFQENALFNTIIMGANGLAGFRSDPSISDKFSSQIPSTDDWPYMYMEKPMVSPLYLEVFAVFFVCAAFAFFLLYRQTRKISFKGNFFLMGLGFTLLESAAIVRLTLLFGSTWIVTSVVFSSALLTVFAGNFLVMKRWAPPMVVAGVGLIAALAANAMIPPSSLLAFDRLTRTLFAATMIGIPVLCTSIGFSRMFASERMPGHALGINLIGAMCGGIFEYLSMWLGMRSIWYVLMAVYATAFAWWWISQRLGKSRARTQVEEATGFGASSTSVKQVS